MLTKQDLIEYFASGNKTADHFKIGIEWEQFLYKDFATTPRRATYDEPGGVKDLLLYFKQFGYEPILENNTTVIGMHNTTTLCNLSIEPGGQFEFAASPVSTLQQAIEQAVTYKNQLQQAAKDLNIAIKAFGFDPISSRDDVPWMPKNRYDIMKAYMPTVGTLGLDMMKRTCTMQVNLDYSSEQDMQNKMKVSMALQPMISACFANSNIIENTLSPYQAFRTFIWQHTDPHRTGILPFVFDNNFGFESYVDYLTEVPMYFIKRNGKYINVAGQSFKTFMTKGLHINGTLETATLADFEDHLTTAFPEVRLKRFIELRGADSGDIEKVIELTTFWTHLFYTPQNLSFALDYIKDWTAEDIEHLYKKVPLHGPDAIFHDKTLAQHYQNICDYLGR